MLCSLTRAAALVLGGCSGGGHGSFTGRADQTRITEDVRFHHYPCTPVLWLILQETVDAGATHTIVVAAGVGVKGHASPAKSPPELSRSNDDVSEFSPQDGGVTSGGRPSSFKHCLLLQDNLQATSLFINKWSILKIFTCNLDFSINTVFWCLLTNLVVVAIGDGVGLDIGPLHLIQDFDSHDRLVVETTQLKHHTITHLQASKI